MRRSRLITVGLVVVVAATGALYLALRPADSPPGSLPTPAGLDEQRIEAGEIAVTIRPVRVDDDGATFEIILDTHSVELDGDLTRATLVVAGTAWPIGGLRGDGPGGHHREGELRFDAAGVASGTAILQLDSLPEPVEARWELPA